MTLLAELQSLDISNILDARVNITLAMENQELQVVLDGGAAQTALAGLGSSLQTLQDSLGEPSAILVPLVDAVGELAGPLSTDELPLAQYLEAVTEGATIIAGLFEGLSDPTTFGSAFGFSLSGALEPAQTMINDYTQVGLDDVVQLRQLIETVESGVPTDPQALAELAIDVLLPFPRANLVEIRDGIRGLLEGARAITFPTGRTAGLVSALEAVATVAATGDAAALEQALQNLELVRTSTISVLRGELLAVFDQIERLHIDEILEPVVMASKTLRAGEEGVLESLETWREQIAAAREQIESFDPALATGRISQLLQMLEEQAQAQIAEPFDILIARLEAWVRELLRHLPLHDLRNELSQFIHAIAQAIQDAELDQYADVVHEMLDEIQSFAESANLGAEVQAALGDAQQAITDALGDLVSALGTIGTEIEALATQAEEILGRVANALADFQTVVGEVTVAVENLGIEQAQQQVVDTLRELREAAEALLSLAPLPDSMRPTIEQLINTLEGVDFDVVFEPVRAAVAELEIPDEVSATITEALEATKDALENLIPAELIEAIETEVNEALDVIRDFDPTALLGGVTDTLNEAADFIEGLDPRPAVEGIRGPYQAILDAVDAVHPRVLLSPVVEAYDSLMSSVPTPPTETIVQQTGEAIGAVGEALGQATVEPIRQFAPEGAVEIAAPGGEAEGGAEAPEPAQFEDIRPGDVIRMLGYLPNKLREVLADLGEGPAGEALQAIDSLCGGLAQDLRSLQAALGAIESRVNAGVDRLLLPLGTLKLQAQIAIQVNFSADSFDVNGALGTVALAGPGSMRAALAGETQLARERARAAARSAAGRTGATLERAADALERCLISSLCGDLDAFLAALDPEPIAAELDALVAAAMAKLPEMLTHLGDDLRDGMYRVQALIREFSPGTQAQRLLVVFDVLREELEILDPRRLVAELGEVHAAIRDTIAAYDPSVFAEEVYQVLEAVAASLRSLDPASLLGDLTDFNDILTQVEEVVPANALAGVGESLTEVGAQLAELDPAGLLATLESLGPEVIDAFEAAVEAIRREIVALLEAIGYASGSVSVSVTAEAGAG